jgi:DNA-directed RNA polymerase sigma subunit (sigma70/sigma32)
MIKLKTNGVDEISAALNRLKDEIEELKANAKSEVEPIEEYVEFTAEEVEEIEQIEEEAEEVFDWENSDDEPALIEFAESIGLDVDARATPNSLKKKIKATLGE